ncbi:MAG: hypothetical protein A2Y71_15915 [Bacteroidetes bacterium RBG_13_42_15]|nr:MAG: hypothetical protein A2Y71_15915 [Bacteroidetes bacterium RBG_13_42_15]
MVKIILNMLILQLLLIACHKQQVNLREMSPEEQLEYAMKFFEKKDYQKAKMQLTIVVLNNPGSGIIEKAQFFLGESYFNSKEYILAIEEYEKLLRSLPQSPYVDDARFKVGMCYYKLSPGYALDQEYTIKAITQFQYFLEEFSNSDLKPQVEEKLLECRNKLAKKKFKSGELYRKMGYYRSALIPFDGVLSNYTDTDYADDALYWKGECLRKLGEMEESKKAFLDLLNNYDKSEFVNRAIEKIQELDKVTANVPAL